MLMINENRTSRIKRNISIILNLLVFIFSALGITLACIYAVRDGYSHWTKRLLYFTQLSNVWIGLTCLAFGIASILEQIKGKKLIREWLYALKFIFTVSITITGIIFCGLLAPFADYNIWTFSSVITHVVVPILSVLDLFLGQDGHILKFRHTFTALIPPAAYFLVASILCILRVDFGKGDCYPYFFMNLHSDVGLFGFKEAARPEIGTFYWVVFLLIFIYGLSFAYYKIYNTISKKALKDRGAC